MFPGYGLGNWSSGILRAAAKGLQALAWVATFVAVLQPVSAQAQEAKWPTHQVAVTANASVMVIFIHGSLTNNGVWTTPEVNAVCSTFGCGNKYQPWSWLSGEWIGSPLQKSSPWAKNVYGRWPKQLNLDIASWRKSGGDWLNIVCVGQSNGGNIACRAAANIGKENVRNDYIDVIVRLGSPPVTVETYDALGYMSTTVFDVYDTFDGVAFGWAKLFGFNHGHIPTQVPPYTVYPSTSTWIEAPAHTEYDNILGGWTGKVHAAMHDVPVWKGYFEPVWFNWFGSYDYPGQRP